MSKISKVAAGLAVVPVLAFAAPVFADSPGQLMGGANVYAVKNLTQHGNYGATANASACDELQYSVELHNTEFGKISNITVKASLPSASALTNKSDMTASGTNAAGTIVSTSGSVTVNLSTAQAISYESGSAQLFNGSGTLIKSLPNGITTGNGVNIGDLNGSTTEFVNFKAKVNCPIPTPPPVTPPTTPPVTPPTTPVTPVSTPTPTVLPNTGAGNVIGIVAGAIVAGAIASRLYLSRKIARS